jgi:hypothetical protein
LTLFESWSFLNCSIILLVSPFLPIHRVMCEAFLCHFARPVLFIALSAPTITATCIMSWFCSQIPTRHKKLWIL